MRYLTLAHRNFRRHKGYGLLNIAGLALGIACCLLILLFVRDELSYDLHHERADRIYRAVLDLEAPSSSSELASTPAALAPLLAGEFQEVEKAVRFYRPSSVSIRRNDRLFSEEDFFFADAGVFDVFSLPLMKGDPRTALAAPYSIVLTESASQKYFGAADPMGELLTVEDTLQYRVTGILRDLAEPSHFEADFLVSMSTWETLVPSIVNGWAPHIYHTYVLLSAGSTPDAVERKLPALVEKNVPFSVGWSFEFKFQPLKSIHLTSHRDNEMAANGRIELVYIFAAIASFILLIACVNFMNLATARFAERTREVGMRKVLGARRSQLIRQFLSEALVYSFLSVGLALPVAGIALPVFNAITGKSLDLGILSQWPFVVSLVLLAVVVGLLAGSYPAAFLSSFRPLVVLKGDSGGRKITVLLRKGLVVFQFAVSIFLIAGTGIVVQQVGFMRSLPLGFEPEQIVVAPSLKGSDIERYETLRAELLRHSAIRSVSASSTVPGRGSIGLSFHAEGMPEEEWTTINTLFVDADFAKTYGMEIVAGRDFSREMSTDAGSTFILNEAAAAKIGWTPDEAVGKSFALRRGEGRVVGVVRDFHHSSLQQSVAPLVLVSSPVAYASAPLYVSARIEPSSEGLALMEKTWRVVAPHRPFDYFFLDADFDRQYRAERRLGMILGAFAGLAVLIGCLGMFGLAAFAAQRRTKEIGVRKVLGASVASVVGLLSADFLKLIAFAFLLATPLVYLAMSRWLDGFAYRVEIGPGVFALTAALVSLLALLAVSYQSIKAARTDPVKSLRMD